MTIISKEEEEEEEEEEPFMIDDAITPDHVLFEILQKLPLKSIFMFKSVSKRWNSLISTPFFSKTYTIRSKNNLLFLQQQWTLLFRYLFEVNIPSNMIEDRIALINTNQQPYFKSQSFTLRFLPSEQRCPIKIIASSNGLLLCCSRIYWQKEYYVCNPLTMEWVSLPEPSRTLRWVSVGFFSDENSYKVVRFPVDDVIDKKIELEIFSSETGEWYDYKLDFPLLTYHIKTDALVVQFNGYLHWQEFRKNKIIIFDPYHHRHHHHHQEQEQEFKFIELPENRESSIQRGIGVCCDELCYYEVTDDYLKEYCYLRKWVLADYDNGKWVLVNKINFCDLWSDDEEIKIGLEMKKLNLFPLAIHSFDPDLLYFWYEHCLVLCSLRMSKLEVVRRDFYSHELLPFLLPPWPTHIPPHHWSN